jgi:hypothetical protein
VSYLKVYDLKDDAEKIAMIQKATLETDHAGLKIENGLFGTKEWWESINKGLFPKRIVEGKISQVYMSGHGSNYPEFEIENSEGKTQWTREGDDKYFIVGKKVRLTYVLQKFKKLIKVLGEHSETVLVIEIEK